MVECLLGMAKAQALISSTLKNNCVCFYLCVCARSCGCPCVYGGQRSASGIIPQESSILFLETGSLIALELV